MSEPLWTPPPPPGGFGGDVLPPPAAAPLPWEDRQRLGFFPALIETVKLFVTAPAAAFARARRSGDYTSPLLYAVLVGWVCAVVAQIWGALFKGVGLGLLPSQFHDSFAAGAANPLVAIVVTLVLAPIVIAVLLFIWSGIVHLFLMMVGGTGSSTSGFEGTLRAVSYAATSQLAQVVPVVGVLIAIVWWIVLAIEGLAAMHGTSKGKAAAAVLLPVGLCCFCVAVAIFAFGAAIIAALGAAASR